MGRSFAIKGRYKIWRFLLVSVIGFISLIVNAEDGNRLASAAYDHLAAHGDHSHPSLRIFSVDLNGDAFLDGIDLLSGKAWCGSGGCNMLIFRGTAVDFSFVSESTVIKAPLMISPEINHGWRTIIVSSGRTGKVLMEFDGGRYPSNPSLQPKPSPLQIKQSQELQALMLYK